jgi:Fur family ferric uptake transcriptional regulator
VTVKNRIHPPASPGDPSAEATARLAARLARAGLRHSRPRDAVVDTFLGAPGHVSVEELTALVRRRAPAVGHTTVYRTMRLLAAHGLATAHDFGDGPTRYEPALRRAHHDHLICTACGAILEFEDRGIEELQETVARRHGFEVSSHRMELHGRCATCIAAGRSRPRAGPRATVES